MKYSITFKMVNNFLIVVYYKKEERNRKFILLQKRFSKKSVHKIGNSTKYFRQV